MWTAAFSPIIIILSKHLLIVMTAGEVRLIASQLQNDLVGFVARSAFFLCSDQDTMGLVSIV